MSTIVICVLLEILSSLGRDSCGMLTAVGPRNIASVSNSTVTFSCKTNSSSQIRWQYVEQRSKQSFIIYNGVDFIVPALAERLTVNHVLGADTVASSLTFNRVETSDSGTYQCLPMKNALVRLSFELIVLDEPMCNLRTRSSDSTVRTSDTVEVWCRVGYSGNWAPVIKCLPDNVLAANVSRLTNDHSVEFYIRIMVSAVSHDINRLVSTCVVSFEGTKPTSNTSGLFDDASPPTYMYTWMPRVHSAAASENDGHFSSYAVAVGCLIAIVAIGLSTACYVKRLSNRHPELDANDDHVINDPIHVNH